MIGDGGWDLDSVFDRHGPLGTPLRRRHCLGCAAGDDLRQHVFRLGEKRVSAAIVEQVLSRAIDDLEPTLTRNGYDAPALIVLLRAKPAEVREFLAGTLAGNRTREFASRRAVHCTRPGVLHRTGRIARFVARTLNRVMLPWPRAVRLWCHAEA
jgi:hypothetical protein